MKSNQKYKPLKTPSYLLYLAFMAAFALAALYFRQYLLAAAEGGITLILAIVALVMKRKKQYAAEFPASDGGFPPLGFQRRVGQ